MPLPNYGLERLGVAFITLGHTSVLFFFVLSGFVLALKIFKHPPASYLSFQLGRLARLLPPFACAMLLTLILFVTMRSETFAKTGIQLTLWSADLSLPIFLRHIFLVGINESDNTLNGPAWSLIYEVRVGFFIPIFCYLLSVIRLSHVLAATALLYGIGQLISSTVDLPNPPYTGGGTLLGSLGATIHYFCSFFVGCALAKATLSKRDTWIRTPYLWLASCVLLVLGTWLRSDLTTSLACGSFIVIVLRGGPVTRLLQTYPAFWLGRLSYPLYLIHVPILYALFHAFWDRAPSIYLSGLTLILSLAGSAVMYVTVETWSIALSRRFNGPRVAA
ncbi:MAG: acyltransferase [Hyphomicrobiales bacterium]|nr:acyltransferase [Hyphomicrobiales bacterium]